MDGIPMAKQKTIIQKTLTDYQGDENRRDDVAVLGFSVRKGREVDSKIRAEVMYDSRFTVGFDAIDDDHKKLFSLVNDMNESIESGDREMIARKLNGLYKYTCWHFRHEEQLMQDSEYPRFDDHKREHLSLKTKILEVKRSFDAGNDQVISLVPDFIKHWLFHHIQEVDMELGRFLAQAE